MNSPTPRTRSLLTVIFAIVAAVLLSLALWSVTAGNQGSLAGAHPWIAMSVVGLSAIAGLAVYVQDSYARRAAKLQPDYYREFQRLAEWLQLSTLSRREQAEVLTDVLGLLHNAQALNRPASDVVGNDPAEFVSRIQESHGRRNAVAFRVMDSLGTLAWLLPLAQAAIWLVRRSEELMAGSYFETPIGIQLIPYMVVLAAVVMPLTQAFLARGRAGAAVAVLLGLGLTDVVMSKLLRRFAYGQQWIRTFLDGEVVLIGSWTMLLAWTAVFAVTILARSYLRQVSLRQLQQ